MSLHHARSLARIYSRTWVVTMVMNIAIYALALLQVQKIRKDRQHSPVLVWLSLCKPFKGMRVFNCNWIRKIKYFSIFFLRFSLRSSLKRLEPYHYYFLSLRHLSNFQPSDQTIFLGQASRLGHETRPHQQPIRWSAPDQTTTSDNRTSLRSNHTMHQLPHQTIVRPDHQNQPIRSDHHRHTRPPDQISPTDYHSSTAPLQMSTAHPTSWTGTGQVHCLWVGYRGVYRALDEPCKAYFPHTFGLKFSDIFFRLNLTVVRLVSGCPGLVRASPSLFHKLGSFAGVRSAT